MAKDHVTAEPGTTLYYVRNPITCGQAKYLVKVIGYDETKGRTPPYVIPRGHVIQVTDKGSEGVVDKWTRNKCIEPYHPKKHAHAVLSPLENVVRLPIPDPDRETPPDPDSQANPVVDPNDVPEAKPVHKKPGDQAKAIGMRDPKGV